MFSIFSFDLSFYFETDFTYCTQYQHDFFWKRVGNSNLLNRGKYGV